ncbi:hypothetical protein OH492_24610 [Vibrio chagasii]|nr:hypothetical protein [Vibrio chagasii]
MKRASSRGKWVDDEEKSLKKMADTLMTASLSPARVEIPTSRVFT